VVVSQQISRAVMFHFAHQDYPGHGLAEGAAQVEEVEDEDLHHHLQHLHMQNQKVHWSSQ
jgi:hypothetical protein